MFSFKVDNKEYKVQFGYRVLCETNLLDRMVEFSRENEERKIQDTIKIVAEMILAGLQKKHFEEFGYETEEEEKKALGKVYDLMDDYDSESTEENPQNCFELFEKVQEELEKNGFLSQPTKKVKKVAKKTNATVIPKN